ncbi:hypothetical protein HNO88_004288 [Novosphingobium chloroacetimidivorans]|uniref:Uncharacterized protein n=1 Tax=Novosphingobium chloroacetimidivorans TaxID=1428314 RepID=A0A7W7KDP6_9SPHN|nr:hypothetical protein [Novosphingobium chloroacetimidivorans]
MHDTATLIALNLAIVLWLAHRLPVFAILEKLLVAKVRMR